MPKRIDPAILDYICQVVPEGATLSALSKRFKIDPTTLRKYLKLRGVPIPHTGKKPLKFHFTIDDIRSLYSSGKTVQQVADSLHCSKALVEKRLAQAGIKQMRTTSETQKLRWSNVNKEDRRAHAMPMIEAKKKAGWSKESTKIGANTRETMATKIAIGAGELELMKRFDDLCIPYISQKAVDIYNIDFVIGTLAIEIHCGSSRYGNNTVVTNKKLKEIIRLGYHVLCIEFQNRTIIPSCIEYVVSTIQKTIQNPPDNGEYIVLRCCKRTGSPCCNFEGHFKHIEFKDNIVFKRKTVHLEVSHCPLNNSL